MQFVRTFDLKLVNNFAFSVEQNFASSLVLFKNITTPEMYLNSSNTSNTAAGVLADLIGGVI